MTVKRFDLWLVSREFKFEHKYDLLGTISFMFQLKCLSSRPKEFRFRNVFII